MTKTSVRNPDIVCNRLNHLHTIDCMPWRKIANLDDYSGIPAGTLSSIARGYPIPRKWLKRLGLPETRPAPVCPRCNVVHLANKCPNKARAKRYGSGATVVIRGQAHEVISHRRVDGRPFAPVLVLVEE